MYKLGCYICLGSGCWRDMVQLRQIIPLSRRRKRAAYNKSTTLSDTFILKKRMLRYPLLSREKQWFKLTGIELNYVTQDQFCYHLE